MCQLCQLRCLSSNVNILKVTSVEQAKSTTYASWLVTGVETLAIAADLPDEAELTTSAYIMYTQIMNQDNTDTSEY